MKNKIAVHVQKILELLGEDINNPNLKNTPLKVAETLEFITSGNKITLDEISHNAVIPSEGEELILLKDIQYYSMCEHTLLPFLGKCHIGYIPDGKIIGVGRIIKVIEMFSRRLQLQERLTVQIAEALTKILKPKGVGVIMEGQHLCMVMKEDDRQNPTLTTSSMNGVFKTDQGVRNEFFSLINS